MSHAGNALCHLRAAGRSFSFLERDPCLLDFFFLVLPVVPHLIRLIIPAQLISNSISTSGISQRETTGREKQRTMSDRGPNLNGDVSSVKSASK